MSVLSNMTKSEWDFSKFQTLAEARNDYTGKISDKWNKTREIVDSALLESAEYEAKRFGKAWRRYILVSELHIDTDEPKMSHYHKAACVLSTVAEDKRNPDHKPLWDAVSKFQKGWKDYSGNMRDVEQFGRLSDYTGFIIAMSDFGGAYDDMLSKAGL